MIRFFDIFFFDRSFFWFPIYIILFLIGFIDTGSPFFKRVGRHMKPFKIYKFRTMHKTPYL